MISMNDEEYEEEYHLSHRVLARNLGETHSRTVSSQIETFAKTMYPHDPILRQEWYDGFFASFTARWRDQVG